MPATRDDARSFGRASHRAGHDAVDVHLGQSLAEARRAGPTVLVQGRLHVLSKVLLGL